jgi:CHAT domain-containing protein
MKGFLTTFIPFLFLLPATVKGQDKKEGMQVGYDASGTINQAMYYKDGQPLTYWVQTGDVTQFEGHWPAQRVLDYLNKALDIKLNISLSTSICLERIGDNYLDVYNDFENTEKFYLAATYILEELGNTQRAGYMYFYLGLLYHDFNHPEAARSYYSKALEVYKTLPDPYESGYATALNHIFQKYNNEREYQQAIPYMEALAALYLTHGDRVVEEKISLQVQLGDLYWNAGLKEQAVQSYLGAVPFSREHYGADSKEYQQVILTFAKQFWDLGYHKEAEPLYSELLALNTPGTLEGEMEILGKLLEFYFGYLNWQKLIMVHERLKVLLEPLGEDNSIYLSIISSLGSIYSQVGEFHQAEDHLSEYLKSLLKTQPESDEEIGSTLITLAGIDLKMYNIERATKRAEEGVGRLERSGKTNHPAYGSGLSTLGIALMLQEEYERSEEYLLRGQATLPRGGYNEVDYAIGLGTLATNYWYQEKMELAEKHYLEAIRLMEESGFDQMREYSNLMGNLSMVYAKTGHYEEAIDWSRKSLDRYALRKESHHPDYLANLHNLALYLEGDGQMDASVDLALKGNAGLLTQVDRNLLHWSERELESYIELNISRYFDFYHRLYLHQGEEHPSLAGQAYDNQLFLKGLLLQSAQKVQQMVAQSQDSLLNDLSNSQKNLREEIEALYALPVDQRVEDPEELEATYDSLQKRIKRRLAEVSETGANSFPGMEAEAVSFRQIREALSQGEATIEFLSFRYYDLLRPTDSIFYCGLVLRPDYEYPRMVFLTVGRELEPFTTQHPDQVYAPGNDRLYKLLIEPMQPLLEGVKSIYFSPTGLLHRFSFAAIPMPKGGVLSDKFILHNLASTRNVVDAQTSFSAETGILYGGIDYNTDTATLARLAGNYEHGTLSEAGDEATTRSFRGSEWTYLPGTHAEAEQISQLLSRGHIYSLTLTGQEATEESFKALSGHSPAIIHVASHGFSFPPEGDENFHRDMLDPRTQQVFSLADHPLLRSGLLFSGANQSWVRGVPPTGAEDGILTAYELSNMDLEKTQLVVLSACETGLGDIKGNEGVFGLQRAMFMAGVRNLIVSLWEVPDFETMELMTLFYARLVVGDSIETALKKARQEMKSQYPDQPSLWAGFELIR